MSQVDGFFERYGRTAVWVMIAAYALVYSAVCFTKYRYYLYTDFDLAIFAQAVDRMLHGSLFSSIRGMNWLGDHSSLILFPLAPLYALARHPLTLLVIQSLALALGALPVLWLARRELRSEALAVACAALYLLYPALGYSNLFEFHPETLATPALLAAFYYLRSGRTRPLLIWAAIALLAKEDVALAVGALSLYALARREDPRRFRHAGALVVMAVVSLVVTFAVLKPLNAGQAEYGDMYKQWGPNPRVAITTMLRRPDLVISQLFHSMGSEMDSGLKREFWIHLLLPLGFLPLLAPLTLAIAAPILAEHLLSWRPEQHAIGFQYTALITPFMVAAAVLGLARVVRLLASRGGEGRAPERRARGARRGTRREPDRASARATPGAALAVVPLACALGANVMFGPLVGHAIWQGLPAREHIAPDGADRAFAPVRDRLLVRLPRDGAVVASFEFLSHLASRPELHSLHHVLQGTYTFSSRAYPIPAGVTALIANTGLAGTSYANPRGGGRVRELLRVNRLAPGAGAGEIVLFLRVPRDTLELAAVSARLIARPRRIRYDSALDFLGSDPPTTTVAPGGELTVATYWRRVAPVDWIYVATIMLTDAGGRRVTLAPRDLGALTFPARDWPADTSVRDPFRSILPVDLAPGRYRLAFGLSWRSSGQSAGIAVPDDEKLRASGGLVELGDVEVAPAQR